MSTLIDSIKIVFVFLMLVLIMFMLYRVYRKVKLVKMGPPKSRKMYSHRVNSRDESTPKVEKNRVIGMIKCEYCGALMPQTAMFCPNCGAPRKK